MGFIGGMRARIAHGLDTELIERFYRCCGDFPAWCRAKRYLANIG